MARLTPPSEGARRNRAAEFVGLALELERLSPIGFAKAIREIRRLLKIR